jgi:hypothetical protein
MANNNRVYYAVQQVGFSKAGANTFTSAHGVQSVGINTKFNLEQVFELGQVSIYQNIENIPDIEITMEKCLDGYPLLYHLATNGATSPSLSGRSNIKSTVGLSIYSDVQDSASGTPLSQCTMSGVFPSALTYNFTVQGNFSEQITLVGQNKVWNNTFTATAFNNADAPLAAEGVNRRQHILFGESSTSGCKLPQDIPGISSSGYNPYSTVTQDFGSRVQSIRASTNLGREQLFELGKRGPFFRYVSFPVEVKTDIETLADQRGDQVTALEESITNVSSRTIYIATTEGTKIDLGTKNKLASVSYGGGNAGQQGGNATCTFSYTTFNDMTVTHPQDPSGL